MSKKLTTPSVLAFERKLDPSDALFYSGNWEDKENNATWQPVPLREKAVRGTISNRPKKDSDPDPAKIDADIEKPNLQTIDIASLPMNADTLKVSFTLRVLGGLGNASACNRMDYQERVKKVVDDYIARTGMTELARRYAYNLANARFLWRNRVGAEQITVRVARLKNGITKEQWDFDALAFSLDTFETLADEKSRLEALTQVIRSGLRGEEPILLEITAWVRQGRGQEVFPSQELILPDRNRNSNSNKKSRILYQIHDIAGMHSQKLGNAIRTIDTWYPESGGIQPIAVEPFGSVTRQGKAYRQPREKTDFYNLMKNWMRNDTPPTEDNQHYVMAILIRGGVFGENSDK